MPVTPVQALERVTDPRVPGVENLRSITVPASLYEDLLGRCSPVEESEEGELVLTFEGIRIDKDQYMPEGGMVLYYEDGSFTVAKYRVS